MKLSKRLQTISNMIPNSYQHIWDTCCDHGFLGAELLKNHKAANIHFVDIVPDLMQQVEQQLARFYPQSHLNETNNVTAKWHVHCIDVVKLPLEKYQGKQLIVIAGVGGDLMLKFVQQIQSHHAGIALDFILCPVYQQFELRQALSKMNMSLKHEELVEDKGRIYDVIYISSQPPENQNQIIHPIGGYDWSNHQQDNIAERYLQQKVQHYRRMQTQNTLFNIEILEQLQALR
ncbi:MAG: tRNA (adenine(22)-N(1))-methyltransferase [Vibrio sp.]